MKDDQGIDLSFTDVRAGSRYFEDPETVVNRQSGELSATSRSHAFVEMDILLVIGGFLVWRLGPGFGSVAYGFAFLSAIGAAILLIDINF